MLKLCLFVAAFISFLASGAQATNYVTLAVPDSYPTISAAVAVANTDTNRSNYYLIIAQPGTYKDDFPTVNRPMTLEVDPAKLGEPVILQATIPLPNQKGIILNHSSLTVIGVTFTGAWIDNSLGGNGAGIRDQSTEPNSHLIVYNSTFSDNQEGVLTGVNPTQTIKFAYTKFKNNGNPDENYFQHGIYVGSAGQFTVDHSVFCGQLIGHDIKSRAAKTTITNSRIYDGQASAADGCRTGSSSFAIDTPNGGNVTISGNQLVQGTASPNYKVVAYGEEGMAYSSNSMIVGNNSFTTYEPNTTMVYIPNCPVKVQQLSTNTFSGIGTGVGTIVNPAGCSQ